MIGTRRPGSTSIINYQARRWSRETNSNDQVARPITHKASLCICHSSTSVSPPILSWSLWFWGRVLLCSPDWPWPGNPPLSASQVPGLETWSTSPVWISVLVTKWGFLLVLCLYISRVIFLGSSGPSSSVSELLGCHERPQEYPFLPSYAMDGFMTFSKESDHHSHSE